MHTKTIPEQKQSNSYLDLTQAREESNKRMNLSSEKPFEWLNEIDYAWGYVCSIR